MFLSSKRLPFLDFLKPAATSPIERCEALKRWDTSNMFFYLKNATWWIYGLIWVCPKMGTPIKLQLQYGKWCGAPHMLQTYTFVYMLYIHTNTYDVINMYNCMTSAFAYVYLDMFQGPSKIKHVSLKFPSSGGFSNRKIRGSSPILDTLLIHVMELVSIFKCHKQLPILFLLNHDPTEISPLNCWWIIPHDSNKM